MCAGRKKKGRTVGLCPHCHDVSIQASFAQQRRRCSSERAPRFVQARIPPASSHLEEPREQRADLVLHHRRQRRAAAESLRVAPQDEIEDIQGEGPGGCLHLQPRRRASGREAAEIIKQEQRRLLRGVRWGSAGGVRGLSVRVCGGRGVVGQALEHDRGRLDGVGCVAAGLGGYDVRRCALAGC